MYNVSKILIISLAALEMVACSVYEAKNLVPEDVITSYHSRSLDDAGLREFIAEATATPVPVWPMPIWDLDDLTLAAFYFNASLEQAYAQWQVADAARISAGERSNPIFSFSPAYNASNSNPSALIATLGLDFLFETFDKRALRRTQASQSADASRLHLITLAWQVRNKVLGNLIDLQTGITREQLLLQQQSSLLDAVSSLEQQLAAGEVSSYELANARMSANNVLIDIHKARQDTAAAKIQLATVIGIPAQELDTIELAFANRPTPSLPVGPELQQKALLARADVLAALLDYDASQTALQLEVAKQYPDFNLGPGYEYDQGDNKWSLGVSFALPALNQNQGAIAEAEARRSLAAANFNALQAQISSDIELALANLATSSEQSNAISSLLDAQQTQIDRAGAMLSAGEISASELTSLHLQLNSLRLQQLDAALAYKKAVAQVEFALQTPVQIPIAPRIPTTNSLISIETGTSH